MRRWPAFATALVLASCVSAPLAGPPLPAPEAAAPPQKAAPLPAPESPKPAPDSAPAVPPVAVAPPDSLALAKLARDSALDAAMLDRLATAQPPEELAEVLAPSAAEAEAATLRSLFDIDVVNWADHGRVKYYVNFFTGLGRERMAIWLERMPLY